jgi:MoaA/NifB/PqqE/SkfB family radical SAM enzyme
MWITAQAPDLKSVVLHGIGEPLLNKELPQIIRGLTNRGVHVLFNSNALLLTPELAEELVASGLDEFRASLDAATDSTYVGVRGSEKFSQVIDNLAELARIRRASPGSKLKVSAWMVGTRENVQDLTDLILLASQIGIDEVYLQRLVYSLDGPGSGLASRDHAIDDSMEDIRQIVTRSLSLSRRLNIRLKASGLASPPESLHRSLRETAPQLQKTMTS